MPVYVEWQEESVTDTMLIRAGIEGKNRFPSRGEESRARQRWAGGGRGSRVGRGGEGRGRLHSLVKVAPRRAVLDPCAPTPPLTRAKGIYFINFLKTYQPEMCVIVTNTQTLRANNVIWSCKCFAVIESKLSNWLRTNCSRKVYPS